MYLSSYRISTVHSCGFPTYAFWEHTRNLFGFALLDANLNIVPRSDAVLDLNAAFKRKRVWFEDVRLFRLNDAMFLSSYHDKLLPISISLPGDEEDQKKHAATEVLPNLFGTGLSVSLGEAQSIGAKGKNFQFFPLPYAKVGDEEEQQGKRNSVLVETWPASPRTVLEIDLLNHSWGGVVSVINESISEYVPEVKQALNAKGVQREFLPRDRGTACCASIDRVHFQDFLPSEDVAKYDHLFVGVAHIKSRKRFFRYLSRLYAFSPNPPYSLVARTHVMCFGFAEEGEMEADPYANITRKKHLLDMFGQTIDCPGIHFVSGITEKVGESKIVLAYGVNDCVSRMVEIEKRTLAEALFT